MLPPVKTFSFAWIKTHGFFLVLLFLISGATFLYFVHETRNTPYFIIPMIDAAEYHNQAQMELLGRGNYFWKPPLYVWWLKLVYSLCGIDMVFIRYIQVLFFISIILLTYLTGLCILSPISAFFGALLLAFNVPLMFFNSQLMPVGIGTLLGMICVYLFLKGMDKNSKRIWFAAGVSGGLGALTLPNLTVFMMAGLFLILHTNFSKKLYGKGILCLFLTVMGFLIFPIYSSLRNYTIYHQRTFLSTNGGINLYIGNNPYIHKTMDIRPGCGWRNLSRIPYQNNCRNQKEADFYFYKKVYDFFMEHPVSFLKNTFYKFRLFFSGVEIPRNSDLYTLREFSDFMWFMLWKIGYFAFPFGIVAPFAFLGMWSIFSSAKGKWIILFVLLYSLSIIFVFPCSRYRVPVLPFFYLMAVKGFLFLWDFRKRSVKAGFFGLIFCFAALTVFVNWPVRLNRNSNFFKSEMEDSIGTVYDYYRNPDQAFKHFKKSVAFDPSNPEGYSDLGTFYRKHNEPLKAILNFEEAIRLNPENDSVLEQLSMCYWSSCNFMKAIESLEKLMTSNPYNPDYPSRLGGYYISLGKYDLALKYFTKAKELDSRNPLIIENMKRCLKLINEQDK